MRRSTRRKLAFSAATLVLVMGALELGARLFFPTDLEAQSGPPPQPEDGAPTMQGNPYLLWEQAPGERMEHNKKATINSLGLRGDEPAIPKPKGVKRLLATGDSSVYGFGVSDGEPFINVAADALGVEGWNAAIPGYSTYQTINMLEMRAWDLEPDVLVVANIWSDNNFDSFVDRELLAAYTSFEGTGAQQMHRLLSPSAFYRVLHFRVRVLKGEAAEMRKVGWTVGRGAQAGRRRVEVNDYATNLERIARMAVDDGREAVFVLLPNKEDVDGPRDQPAAWSLYRDVMRDTAARLGVPLLDCPTLFYESGKSKDELFVDEMHPTTVGHQIIGQALAETLSPWAEGGTVQVDGDGSDKPAYVDQFLFREGGQGKTEAEQDPKPDGPEVAAPAGGSYGPPVPVEIVWKGSNELIIDVLDCGETPPVRVGGGKTKSRKTDLAVSQRVPTACFVVHADSNNSGSPDAGDKRWDMQDQVVKRPDDKSRVKLDLVAGTASLAP